MEWIFRFVVLVWRMRRSQKAYFGERSHGNLVEAKRLEGDVDRDLKRLLVFEAGEPVGLNYPNTAVQDDVKQSPLFE